MFVPLKRAVMLLATPKNPNDNSNHLFIVLTNPNQNQEVLAINITSSDKFDKVCISQNTPNRKLRFFTPIH